MNGSSLCPFSPMFPKLEIEGVKDGIVNVGILTGITIQAVDVIG